MAFASGRELGLISYEKHSRQIPETEICGADGAMCCPAHYPSRWGSVPPIADREVDAAVRVDLRRAGSPCSLLARERVR
ncbi:hypothetical protein ACFVIY_28750 [Streptomyces sp. NPDC127166]|uniref:hypothetical protein n=1 Tax=Streptomyces sp. NPDC127166 TaxID=3345380 RepID=UPI003642F40D